MAEVKWNVIGSDKSLKEAREVAGDAVLRETFTFDVTYSAGGTIGERVFQAHTHIGYTGYTPVGVMITSVGSSANYMPVAFLQPNGSDTYLYLNAYRCTTIAVSNSKVKVTVVYVRGTTRDYDGVISE